MKIFIKIDFNFIGYSETAIIHIISSACCIILYQIYLIFGSFLQLSYLLKQIGVYNLLEILLNTSIACLTNPYPTIVTALHIQNNKITTLNSYHPTTPFTSATSMKNYLLMISRTNFSPCLKNMARFWMYAFFYVDCC